MKNNKEIKNIMVFVVILLLFTSIYLILNKYLNNSDNEASFLKHYEVNEYIPMYVSDEDLTKIYLNDFVYIMNTDVEKAYELLDAKYREKKFASLEAFKEYVNGLNYSTYVLDKFYVDTKGKYTIYGAFDKNGNVFIFKTNGIMQYTVYLDDYTVEI